MPLQFMVDKALPEGHQNIDTVLHDDGFGSHRSVEKGAFQVGAVSEVPIRVGGCLAVILVKKRKKKKKKKKSEKKTTNQKREQLWQQQVIIITFPMAASGPLSRWQEFSQLCLGLPFDEQCGLGALGDTGWG